MDKKVLVISSSFRNNSNSEALADQFMEGAKASGNEAEKITLGGKHIEFCKGCLACQKLGKCVIADDTNVIVEKMLNADVLVFASPVYYYSICGQLKTMLDRANPLFSSEYKFRDIYFMAAAADEDYEAAAGARTAIQGWADCFEEAKFAGMVFAGGVTDAGDVAGHKALLEAFEMGKRV